MGGLGIVFFVAMPFVFLISPLLFLLDVADLTQGMNPMDFLVQFFQEGASIEDFLDYLRQSLQGLSASEFFASLWDHIKDFVVYAITDWWRTTFPF